MPRNVIFVIFFFISCVGTQDTIFKLVEEDQLIDTGRETADKADAGRKNIFKTNARFAVISGTSNDFDTRLSQFITDEVKSNDTFIVIDQNEISKIIPHYPYVIWDIGMLNSEYGNSLWITDKSKSELDSIQKAINADYLFFVWTNFEIYGCLKQDIYITTSARLLQYPQSCAIGYSYFITDEMISFKSDRKVIELMLKKISMMISDELIEKLSIRKSELTEK